jgi:hypothetical protein
VKYEANDGTYSWKATAEILQPKRLSVSRMTRDVTIDAARDSLVIVALRLLSLLLLLCRARAQLAFVEFQDGLIEVNAASALCFH